jgi:hypothetical protein
MLPSRVSLIEPLLHHLLLLDLLLIPVLHHSLLLLLQLSEPLLLLLEKLLVILELLLQLLLIGRGIGRLRLGSVMLGRDRHRPSEQAGQAEQNTGGNTVKTISKHVILPRSLKSRKTLAS